MLKREVTFLGVDPLALTAGAHPPMLPSSWRFGFNDFGKADGPLYFGLQDYGPLVAVDAVNCNLQALRGENGVLRDLLRAADNALDTMDVASDAHHEGLDALRESIARALKHSIVSSADEWSTT